MPTDTRTFTRSTDLFLRLLGGVYFVAFVSFGVQAEGLIGSRGILPVESTLANIAAQVEGIERYWRYPTLLWFGASDLAIQVLWMVGAAAAVALILGLAPIFSCASLWFLYLSVAVSGGIFTAYQWDNLLLEVGLLAVFIAPARWRLAFRHPAHPSAWARFALVFVLFRLVFSSGYLKFTAGDPTWSALTALQYHYWSQPLPTMAAWYVDKLPDAFHTFGCLMVALTQILVPFGLFGTARVRRVSCAIIAIVQILIALTGNYGFFNLLAIVLCVLAVDDAALGRIFRLEFAPRARPAWRWISAVGVCVLLVAGGLRFSLTVGADVAQGPVGTALRALGPFRSVNGYGLFVRMTTDRREIVIEGSHDGRNWAPYVLPYQPGPLGRAPVGFVGHMPRLDWQMWFAALGSPRQNPWLRNLLARLHAGEAAVLDLFETQPFAEKPPRFLRAGFWRYRFTDARTQAETGHWWRRSFLGWYMPTQSAPE